MADLCLVRRRCFAEKLGLRLLRALSQEKQAGKTLLNCSGISEVAERLGFSETEFDRAIKFVTDNRLVEMTSRGNEQAVLFSADGDALLGSKKKERAWTMDRRLTLYGIILAILTLVRALVARYWPR